MSTNELVIRRARREDVPTLLSFMHATALEQNAAAEAIKATESELLSTLAFDDACDDGGMQGRSTGVGHALVVVAPEGKVVGMAIYFLTYVAWAAKRGVCLEDLYVVPRYRRCGYARFLVREVAKQAEAFGCVRMEWLCYKENERALKFYKSLGASNMDNLAVLRLDKEAMVALTNA